MDVLIYYDLGAATKYAQMTVGMPEPVSIWMASDTGTALSTFFGQYWSGKMYRHTDVAWTILDADGYSGSYSNVEQFYTGWQAEIGWPSYTGSWTRYGMSGSGYSGLHGLRFDFLVMYTYLPVHWVVGGMCSRRHNAIIINLAAGLPPGVWVFRGFSAYGLLTGTYTVLCHEAGHAYGLPDNDGQDIMDYFWQTLTPYSHSLTSAHRSQVDPYTHYHSDYYYSP